MTEVHSALSLYESIQIYYERYWNYYNIESVAVNRFRNEMKNKLKAVIGKITGFKMKSFSLWTQYSYIFINIVLGAKKSKLLLYRYNIIVVYEEYQYNIITHAYYKLCCVVRMAETRWTSNYCRNSSFSINVIITIPVITRVLYTYEY